MSYAPSGDLIREVAELLRAPERPTVAESADRHVYISNPNGYNGMFRSVAVKPLIEPMEVLTSREFEALIFAGPAQTAKTQCLVDNWLAYTIMYDPSDMMIVEKSRTEASDFSKTRIERLLSESADLAPFISAGTNDDNILNKMFRHGMMLRISWPSKNTLAGKAIGKIALLDFDRMPEDMGGEGGAFFKALKRTLTFMSRGMVVAESSPARPLKDPTWTPPPPEPGKPLSHQAPPTTGILGLYNTGDRRRWYWCCHRCEAFYLCPPGPEGFWWPEIDSLDILERSEQAKAVCTSCGGLNEQHERSAMIESGRWLKEGQSIDRHGVVRGIGRRSKRASFWQPGATAAFQDWESLVRSYLSAQEQFKLTDDESGLRDSHNVDFGMYYVDKASKITRNPLDLQARESGDKKVVPRFVKALIANIDVQINRFVVQIHGIGDDVEIAVVDRYNLRWSTRPREDGEGNDGIKPGTYLADWEVLLKLFSKVYHDAEGNPHSIDLVFCDSGGADGTTENAYRFWEMVRNQGLHGRFVLTKGASEKMSQSTRVTFPGKGKGSTAHPSMPLLFFDPNYWKDLLSHALERKEDGPGKIHFAAGLGMWFFEELAAEVRSKDGKWKKVSARARNEAWDLLVQCLVGLHRKGWHRTSPVASATSNARAPDGQSARRSIRVR